MSQSSNPAPNSAQIEYWNAAAGLTWAQLHEQLDRQIECLGLEGIRVLAPRAGEQLLDIGCGCGQTSAELAVRVGPSGKVVGVDISHPMLDVARRRLGPDTRRQLDFRQLDAQSGELGRGIFDAAFSRFGVMFFSDPIAAFTNIRAALKPGGRMSFVCWRPFQENLWMRVPMEAALPHLPPMPPADPLAPGPFAFADPNRVHSILRDAGFGSVTITPFDLSIGGSDIEQTLQLTLKVGPLGAALRENPGLADAAVAAVRDAISAYATPKGVLMPAAVWIVRAQNDR